MSRRLARTLLAAVMTAAFVLPGAPAMASTGQIVQLNSTRGTIEVVFQATDLPADVAIDPSTVTVSVAGQTLVSSAKPAASSVKPLQRTAILAFDNSRSMAATGIAAAKTAAASFLGNLPPDVDVGLVTFNDGAQVVSAPTADRTALQAQIDALTINPTRGTALYDAVVAALGQAGTEGTRSILLLTDGQPGRSNATLDAAVAQAADAQTTVNSVYIGPDSVPTSLQQLASGSNGRAVRSDPSQLSDAFASAAQTISKQLQITAQVPPSLAGKEANVTVTATAGTELLRDATLATFKRAPKAAANGAEFGPQAVKPSSTSTLVSDATLPLALLALFLALATAVFAATSGAGSTENQSTRLRRRLSMYTLTGRQATAAQAQQQSTRLGGSHVARSAVELAGRVVQRRDFEAAVGERLEAAGVPLRAAEWMLIHLGAALALPLLLLLVSGGALAPTLIGLVLGVALPWVYLSYKESRRTNAFLTQLPDTLQLVSGSLSAGYSMPQALDTVVREGQQPMTGEFNRALVEARLGVPIEDALEGVGRRMQSKDFAWVVMAIRIQREVGGNLAEILTTVAATLRERERLRRQVQVLSAEGRLSAWILGALPPVFTLYLIVSRPDYLRPLVTQPLGWLLVITGATLLTVGVLWMRKAVKVEV
jgi:tight adherence protein B